MDFSIVIPALNEAPNIGSLIDEIVAALGDRYDYEIICIDDGSSDDTARVLDAKRSQVPRLRAFSHDGTFGQSAAWRSGIRAARAPWIVTMDGDGQNDPADIPALWQRARQEAATGEAVLVNGLRHKRRDRWAKRVASRIANRIRASMLGDRTPDSGCGLKLFPKALYDELPYFDHMHRFMPALAIRHRGRVVSAPVNHRPRRAGVSKYGNWQRLKVGIVDLFGVMWLKRRARLPVLKPDGGSTPKAER